MKKITLTLMICCGVLLLPGLILAQTIVGSAHDFSDDSWNTSGQICLVCHTPHNADVAVSNAPLWNHETTQATFTPYTSATMNASNPMLHQNYV